MKPLDARRLRDRSDVAEIASDRGHWLVVEVSPGGENVASTHLAGRGFGIFLPGIYANGRWAALLPGYIFVNVFGIEHHRTRILACPGITDLLYENGHPSCPYVVPDWFISVLRNRERKAIEDHEGIVKQPDERRKRRRRRRRKSLRIRAKSSMAA